MIGPIAAALSSVEDKIIDDAYASLQIRREPRYSGSDSRQKLRELFRQVVSTIEQGDPAVVSRYCTRIVEERVSGGFNIAEVQAAFNALEESMWENVAGSLDAGESVLAIELVSKSLGAGRDALARAYVAAVSGKKAGSDLPEDDDSGLVTSEVRGRVGLITMQDHKKRNALGAGLVGRIMVALESLPAQDARVVIIRAAPGMSVWSSGHDVDELPRGRRDPLAYNDPLEQCVRAVRSSPLPIIAMVHESVWGGAFDLALSCDVVIADETATFAITPANLGLPYNTTGLLHFLGRLPTNIVKEMFFTAKAIGAHQAERWMVVNHLVPGSELESFTFELAETMAAKAPLAVAAVKEQLRVLSDYQPIAAQVYERIQGLRREAYDSGDYMEGLAAFAERRPPTFRGE